MAEPSLSLSLPALLPFAVHNPDAKFFQRKADGESFQSTADAES
jgi:hypothetical protein